MLPFRQSAILQDPSRVKTSERKIMDGVIHSGVLNAFQTEGVDGLVQSGMPHHRRSHGGGSKPILHSSKKPATPFAPGFVKYPGSSMDS